MFIVNQNNLLELTQYLRKKLWLSSNESVITASKPGEGNMNCVLRIDTGSKTFIIKQSKDFVEKYPQVPAPAERAISEAAFYECIKQDAFLQKHTPKLLGIDEENNILLLEDLGNATDYAYLYNKTESLKEEDAIELTTFLYSLHNSINKNNDPLLRNPAMKKLNHEYIFVYPFLEDNNFNLDNVTTGLQHISMQYKTDDMLKKKAAKLGKRYLSEGKYLLHGDYYPSSWLNTTSGIKIIDPEFCFFGDVEFDLAVMLAHCYLSEQPQNIIDVVLHSYKKNDDFNETLLYNFTGIEMIRRILGLAQLPLVASLDEKKAMLEKSCEFIML